MNYAFLKQLLEQAEAFEQDKANTEEPTLAGFATWISGRFPTETTASILESTGNQDEVDTEIAVLVSYLYRYARLYGKKALAETPLATIDEFSYIVMLLEGPPPTKTELIERNIHEKTTGTEILRRLINGGLIEQFDDTVDKRSKRLKLTPAGKTLMMSIWPGMSEMASVVSGNLTRPEKKELVTLLRKLHLFHNHIFMTERDVPLTILAERLNREEK